MMYRNNEHFLCTSIGGPLCQFIPRQNKPQKNNFLSQYWPGVCSLLATQISPYIFSPQPQHIIVFYNPEVSCQYNCTILVIIIYVMSNMWPQHSLHVVYGTISIKWFLIEVESWPLNSNQLQVAKNFCIEKWAAFPIFMLRFLG